MPNPTRLPLNFAPVLLSSPERLQLDLDNVKLVVARMEKEAGESRGSKAIEEKIASNSSDGVDLVSSSPRQIWV